MDLKHELAYRGVADAADLLLPAVKTEPRLHSPLTAAADGGLGLVVSGAGPTSSAALIAPGGGGGLYPGPPAKRPRPGDDWLASPSPGALPQAAAPPLTPSPGPQPGGALSTSYTVITNGYSSPMSSGSYDPYSPNGKIGKSLHPTRITSIIRTPRTRN